MQYVIGFEDSEIDGIRDHFCKQCKYEELVLGDTGDLVPNPQSKDDFIVEKARQYIIESAKANEITEALDLARQAVLNKS